jgi:hypothetical protein
MGGCQYDMGSLEKLIQTVSYKFYQSPNEVFIEDVFQ